MMPWRLYSDAAQYIFTWLIGYGALLGPIAGILIMDYFVLRRSRLDVDGLYQRQGPYAYHRGVNWVAMLALAAGVAPNVPGFLGALGLVDAGPLASSIYNWAWFVGFGLSSALYVAGMKAMPSGAAAVVPDHD